MVIFFVFDIGYMGVYYVGIVIGEYGNELNSNGILVGYVRWVRRGCFCNGC